jgi:hypothetical protein
VGRPFEPGTSWLSFSGEHEAVPVRELYGVFARPRSDADRAAERLAEVAWSGIDWRGEIALAEGRVFLSGLGGEEGQLYAAPLGEDRLVVAVLPNGGGGSGRPGPDGLFLLQSQRETGELVVHGIVADPVESVDVVVAGRPHEAVTGENAFGLRLEGTRETDLDRLVLHRRDGTTGVFELRPDDSD